MYEDLFDKVKEIVKNNGKDILKEKKFWHILTDEYSFQKDPILKMIFKEVLNTAYVKEISSSFLKKQSLSITRRYFDDLKNRYPNDEEEIIASLFSIAIGLGKCSSDDYTSFNKKNNPAQKNKKPPKPKKKTSLPSCLKTWERYLLWVALISGLIVTVGGTWIYWLFFRGSWMVWEILFIAIIQFPYAGFMWLLYKLNRNKKFKKTLILTLYPFAVAALINSVLWFPFMIAYDFFGNWFELYGAKSQDGTTIFFALFFGIGLTTCMYNIWRNVRNVRDNYLNGYDSWVRYDKPFVKHSIFSLIILYFILLGVAPCFRKIRNYYGDKHQVNENYKIAAQRSGEIKDLSYMGISIGENYTQVLDSVIRKSPVVFYADCHVTITGGESVWQVIDGLQSNHTDTSKDEPGPDNVSLRGQHFWQFDSLYNEPLTFYVYGFNNIIQLIQLKFKNEDLTKNEFSDIENIYQQKYGSPESYNTWDINSYGEGSKFSYNKDNHNKEDIFIWTFQNGMIYLSKEEILYVSKELYALIQEKQEESLQLKAKIKQQEIERQQREEFERQEKERLQQIQDSLNEVENFNRALKNI